MGSLHQLTLCIGILAALLVNVAYPPPTWRVGFWVGMIPAALLGLGTRFQEAFSIFLVSVSFTQESRHRGGVAGQRCIAAAHMACQLLARHHPPRPRPECAFEHARLTRWNPNSSCQLRRLLGRSNSVIQLCPSRFYPTFVMCSAAHTFYSTACVRFAVQACCCSRRARAGCLGVGDSRKLRRQPSGCGAPGYWRSSSKVGLYNHKTLSLVLQVY